MYMPLCWTLTRCDYITSPQQDKATFGIGNVYRLVIRIPARWIPSATLNQRWILSVKHTT